MPRLGSSVGRVTEWRVAPGDSVRPGDLVALVEIDKGIVAIEAFEEGVVVEILAPEGAEAQGGDVIARMR